MGIQVNLARVVDDALARLPAVLAEWLPSSTDRALEVVATLLPHAERFALATLDTIFSPRLVARQLAAASALQIGLVIFTSVVAVWQRALARVTKHGRETARLARRMRDAGTYAEWRAIAEELDRIEASARAGEASLRSESNRVGERAEDESV
jgi:hypothetical protein